ncbi:MAG TPA: hypothetical protein VGS19_11005 [Streptosporangiaceae bacterium]|nr:hypothetical protein [Streptosporangiaceae bacterium]
MGAEVGVEVRLVRSTSPPAGWARPGCWCTRSSSGQPSVGSLLSNCTRTRIRDPDGHLIEVGQTTPRPD